MTSEVEQLIFMGIAGLTGLVVWLLKLVGSDHRKALMGIRQNMDVLGEKFDVEVKAVEKRINSLEKTDIAVQIHLDSLKQMKEQFDAIQHSMAVISGMVRSKDNEQ